MKKVIFCLTLLASMSISAFADEKGAVQFFTTKETAPDQKLSYELTTEGLRISGFLFVNCCGEHYMNYNVSHTESDGYTIKLKREDRGPLCDCQEPHAVDFVIPGISLDETYTIILEAYNDYEDYADKRVVTEIASPQADLSRYTIHCQENFRFIRGQEESFTAELFDLSGQRLWIGESKKYTLKIPMENLPNGTYLCKLTDAKGTETIKLLK